MTSILIIDDETAILKVVSAYLEAEGYTLHTASDGKQGMALFRRYAPDLIILDVMLPGMDGFELLQQIRHESEVYVLMLTAKSEEMDRVIGLTMGADDYLTKPFSPRELVARVKAILRRGRGTVPEEKQSLNFRHVRIDLAQHKVWVNDQPIECSALDFKLLTALASYPNRVLSREQLLEQVWGYVYYGEDRVVDVHIGHLRQKLEADPANPRLIVTVRGVGYRFEDEVL